MKDLTNQYARLKVVLLLTGSMGKPYSPRDSKDFRSHGVPYDAILLKRSFKSVTKIFIPLI